MSNLQAFLWGAVGGAIYPALSFAVAIRASARSGAALHLSLTRLWGFAIIVVIQCGLGGLMSLFVLGGLHERRVLAAVFIGAGSVSLFSALLTPAGAGPGSPVSFPPERSEDDHASFRDLLRSSSRLITSERVTAAAAVAAAIIALLAYVTG